ncbi:MAG TPA: phytoene/squalene synthase family protein [Kofleriaceae bacterium]|nr:phytoene/squalene synthase family protein [Kofleriaceae bacterium]
MTELALAPASPAALARATIAHHSKSFALASRLLDPRTRDQTAIVYAFCRRADDAVDLGGEPATAVARLRQELADACRGVTDDRVLGAFADVVRERRIPRRYPEELLAGMAMDAAGTRYATLEELRLYCHRVAGVVGLMMCHVFGVRDDAALVPGAQLGIAMQLTNICRDVAEDWERGRLYVPDDVLARHGASGLGSDLGRPLPRSAVRPLAGAVGELLALADRGYRAARRGMPALPWRAGLAVRAAASIYAAIGARLRARGCDVTAGRAVVGRAQKLALVAGAAGRTLAAAPRRALAPRAQIPTRTVEAGDVPFH